LTIAKVAESFSKDYGQNWAVKVKPYEGIVEMLSMLVSMDMPMAILSNKPHVFTEICVAKMLADFSFFPVLGQQEGIAKKPDPAGAIEVAEILSVCPEQVLFLGDSSVDMLTAGRAGMTPVGALWGFRDERELKESGAEYLLSHPSMLIKLLQAS
jgi:phosphoglycolate phosphatase